MRCLSVGPKTGESALWLLILTYRFYTSAHEDLLYGLQGQYGRIQGALGIDPPNNDWLHFSQMRQSFSSCPK